jgi:hypothetical protein
VLAAGPAGATPLVLLHGGGATATAWARVARELCVPGARPRPAGSPGRSTSSRPFRTTADRTAWLAELSAALDVGPVHLVGHPAGAHLALAGARGAVPPRAPCRCSTRRRASPGSARATCCTPRRTWCVPRRTGCGVPGVGDPRAHAGPGLAGGLRPGLDRVRLGADRPDPSPVTGSARRVAHADSGAHRRTQPGARPVPGGARRAEPGAGGHRRRAAAGHPPHRARPRCRGDRRGRRRPRRPQHATPVLIMEALIMGLLLGAAPRRARPRATTP